MKKIILLAIAVVMITGCHSMATLEIDTWVDKDTCVEYLTRYQGSIRVESFDRQDGQKRYVTKVVVQNYEFLDSKKKDSAKNSAEVCRESTEESVSSIYTDEIELNDEDLPF